MNIMVSILTLLFLLKNVDIAEHIVFYHGWVHTLTISISWSGLPPPAWTCGYPQRQCNDDSNILVIERRLCSIQIGYECSSQDSTLPYCGYLYHWITCNAITRSLLLSMNQEHRAIFSGGWAVAMTQIWLGRSLIGGVRMEPFRWTSPRLKLHPL